MAERKGFLLRLDPATYAALQSWAADELRSLNGQIEWLLREALREAGRLRGGRGAAAARASDGFGSGSGAEGESEPPEVGE